MSAVQKVSGTLTCRPSSLPITRLLRRFACKLHQVGGRYFEGLGKFADIDERYVSLATLNAAEVAAGKPTLQGQFFLRPALGPPDLSQVLTE